MLVHVHVMICAFGYLYLQPARVEQREELQDPLLMNMMEEMEQRETRRQERHRQRAYQVPGQ